MGRKPKVTLNGHDKTAKTKLQSPAEIAKEIIDRTEVRRAAAKAVEEIEQDPDLNFLGDDDDTEIAEAPEQPIVERDIFTDAPKKAMAENDAVKLYIYKNSQFTTIRNHPYSWEKLQAEFGEGHYRVVAKSIRTGKNYMVQSELVGDPKVSNQTPEKETESQQTSGFNDPISLFTFVNQMSDKAESKATAQANAQSQMMTGVFQAMAESQQRSSQQFQMMILEMQKETRAREEKQQSLLMSLVTVAAPVITAFLTKKEKDDGFTAAKVMEMISNAENKAEERTRLSYDMIEEKAEKMAEEKYEAMAAGGAPEKQEDTSLIGQALKALSLVAGGAAATQAAPIVQGPSPQQIESERNLRIQQQQIRQSQMLDQREKAKVAARVAAARPVGAAAPAASHGAPKPPPAGASVAPIRPAVKQAVPNQRPVNAGPPKPQGVQNMTTKPGSQAAPTPSVKDLPEADRNKIKDAIFETVKFDVRDALISSKPASQTARHCLNKLEKHGVSRQTIAEAFTLEEFFDLARANGVPDLEAVNAWIAEFYDHVTKAAATTSSPIPVSRPPDIVATTTRAFDGPDAGAAAPGAGLRPANERFEEPLSGAPSHP